MKKIKSLFKRNYGNGDQQIYNEVVEGSEWEIEGNGWATIKHDGTCCMVKNGQLYKRYDRKLTKSSYIRIRNLEAINYIPKIGDYKVSPDGWIAAEKEPNVHTGHWPGWLLVGDLPQDKWHREGWEYSQDIWTENGTYELVGPKIQNNSYNLSAHQLWEHGCSVVLVPRDFEGIKEWLENNIVEGIVWHNADDQMVKIRRRDFGLNWPDELMFVTL